MKLSVVLAPAAAATTYKWVDDQGIVHYSDKIPPEAVNKVRAETSKALAEPSESEMLALLPNAYR